MDIAHTNHSYELHAISSPSRPENVISKPQAADNIVFGCPMAPKHKPNDQLGNVYPYYGGWRVNLAIGADRHKGPRRAMQERAEEDLRAMRALPRSAMVQFLQICCKVAHLANAAPQTTPTAVASFTAPMEVLPSVVDSAQTSDARDASDVTPAKRHKTADGEGCGIASATPRRDGCLSPDIALRLAQSCRKSPAFFDHGTPLIATADRADAANMSCSTAVASDRQRFVLDAAEEKRLLGVAQTSVQELFKHVRRLAKETRSPLYLPTKKNGERKLVDSLHFIRRKHKEGKLKSPDYQLLALAPHILGPTVYGAVETCESGWRWTFVPAGVDMHGAVFLTEAAAADDLRLLQKALFPAWLIPDNRAAHLEQLLRLRSIL